MKDETPPEYLREAVQPKSSAPTFSLKSGLSFGRQGMNAIPIDAPIALYQVLLEKKTNYLEAWPQDDLRLDASTHFNQCICFINFLQK